MFLSKVLIQKSKLGQAHRSQWSTNNFLSAESMYLIYTQILFRLTTHFLRRTFNQGDCARGSCMRLGLFHHQLLAVVLKFAWVLHSQNCTCWEFLQDFFCPPVEWFYCSDAFLIFFVLKHFCFLFHFSFFISS